MAVNKKVLYISHIDWNWIKQRPQFIAEGLEDKNINVKKMYQFSFSRKLLQKNGKRVDKNLFPFFKLPFSNRSELLNRVSTHLLKLYFRFVILLFKPDYVWLTHPTLIAYIPDSRSFKLIYDCMDDNAEFHEKNCWQYNNITRFDKACINSSDYVFCTSSWLQEKIANKYNIKASLSRNAFGGKIITEEVIPPAEVRNMAYFGTISNWFDFESILYVLEQIPDLTVDLYGPIESGVIIPSAARLNYRGVANHSELFSISKGYSCLLMPFTLNDLVLGVDPVKLYEYVNFGNNIISVQYVEVERFSPFVHFYNTKDELKNIIINGLGKKYTEEQRIQFIDNNSWSNRVDNILSVIN
ncbi:hypothetical protein H5125_14575 [Shewanella sp. SR44-4]|uniref:hypothetical protein n=1 Tax=Shewanella sp. SR44-4 TaxID=2760935 RepID=UPI0016045A58|nr:hypothetical protein [Shewanella sp. SR44-4]MBB1363369.1 hypothetical protein [Shewanella sp. SR44-4]